MAAKKQAQVPEVDSAKSRAAAAGEKAMKEIKRSILLNEVKPEDIIMNDPATDVVKGNQYDSDIWLHGPATVELMSSSHKQLLKAAGPGINKVDRVRLGLIKGTEYLVVWPTKATDPNGIEVKAYQSSAFINAITVLGPDKMSIKWGVQERYTVEQTPEGFPGGPGLVIDLSKRLERRVSAKANAAATPKAKSTRSRAKQNPAADTPTPLTFKPVDI